MEIILTLRDNIKWRRLLYAMPASQQDVYFTPEYYALHEQNGDGEARCFVYEETVGSSVPAEACKEASDMRVMYPFLMNSVNALGYEMGGGNFYDIQGAYGYNGIITTSDDTAFINRFHDAFDQYCHEAGIIAEFSRFHPLLYNHRLASPKMQTFYSRKTVRLNLDASLDDLWMHQISTKNRNLIRRAEKDGITIEESNDYETFRLLYNQTMDNVGATEFYYFPKEYYERIRETFGTNAVLCMAKYQGKAIAGSIFLFSGNYAHYHLSGRDSRYGRMSAGNLLLWYGIQMAKLRGCRWMHFGGGTSGEDNDPLFHFKQNFSRETGEFWIGKRIHNSYIYNQVVEQWRTRNPENYEKNNKLLLGYREIT